MNATSILLTLCTDNLARHTAQLQADINKGLYPDARQTVIEILLLERLIAELGKVKS